METFYILLYTTSSRICMMRNSIEFSFLPSHHGHYSFNHFTESVPAEGTMFESPAFKVFDFLFGIPLIHDIMFGIYRKQIVEKAGKNEEHSTEHSLLFVCRIYPVVECFTSMSLLG